MCDGCGAALFMCPRDVSLSVCKEATGCCVACVACSARSDAPALPPLPPPSLPAPQLARGCNVVDPPLPRRAAALPDGLQRAARYTAAAAAVSAAPGRKTTPELCSDACSAQRGACTAPCGTALAAAAVPRGECVSCDTRRGGASAWSKDADTVPSGHSADGGGGAAAFARRYAGEVDAGAFAAPTESSAGRTGACAAIRRAYWSAALSISDTSADASRAAGPTAGVSAAPPLVPERQAAALTPGGGGCVAVVTDSLRPTAPTPAPSDPPLEPPAPCRPVILPLRLCVASVPGLLPPAQLPGCGWSVAAVGSLPTASSSDIQPAEPLLPLQPL